MKKGRTENKGSVLVMAVVLSFAAILIGVAFLTSAVTLHDLVSDEISVQQATYGAISGAMWGVARKAAGDPASQDWQDFYDETGIGFRVIDRGQDDLDWGVSNNIRIVGTGQSEYENTSNTRSIVAEYIYETYADFLYLSHRERDSLRHVTIDFWSLDTLDGKVHSNDTIRVSGTPVFKERVTTTRCIYPPNNNARFEKDWGYRAPITFPDQVDEIRAFSGYNWGTQGPDSVTHIVLSGNRVYMRKCGLFMVNGVDSIRCFPEYISESYPIPASGVIFIHGKVWVSASRGRGDLMDGPFPERVGYGEFFVSEGFSGQLTIGSSDTMIITDNIIYKNALPNYTVPATMELCPDVLGLVSESYIMVGKQVRNTVYINAALAAVRGSISVQDIYMNHYPDWDNEKQSLFIWGSLAQRNRGIVHTTTFPPGHLRGFREKDYFYDVRLMTNPPPHFLPTLEKKLVFIDDLGRFGGD